LLTSCKSEPRKDSKYYCEKLSINCSINTNEIIFITSKGKFNVELYTQSNPITVSNFLKNIEKGIYENKKFYKVIKLPNTKIIQSGINSNFGSQKGIELQNFKTRRSIPLEIAVSSSNEPIYNFPITDPTKIKDLRYFFKKGSLAMIKTGDKSSSSTEFFFTLNNSPEFDGRYTIFGKVIKGFDNFTKIEKGDVIFKINPKDLDL
tara:strand:- start:223 stop:837 length:615 start_codon:yes stop_codon:yes gene_type:complete